MQLHPNLEITPGEGALRMAQDVDAAYLPGCDIQQG